MKKLMLFLVVFGFTFCLASQGSADPDNEAVKAKVFYEASTELATTHPDLAKGLRKLADDEAKEIGKKDDDKKNEIAREDATEAKLLADSVTALQNINPALSARLRQMEDVVEEKD